MVRHLHIQKLDQVVTQSDVQAGTLITRNSIFFDDVCLRHRGELRAFKLKSEHIPTFLIGKGYEVIEDGRCIDYLELAQENDHAWTIHELFPDHYWDKDFDEVALSHDTWQPQIDALQSQITDITQVYSTDDERIQYLAEQLASGGLIFDQVDAKVLVETNRAQAAEVTLTTAVGDEYARAHAAELAIESFFEGTNTNHDNDRAQIKLDFAAADLVLTNAVGAEVTRAQLAESANTSANAVEKARAEAAEAILTGAVSAEESRALTAEGGNSSANAVEKARAEAAEAVLTAAIGSEVTRAQAAESVNDGKITVEKTRIDAILNLSSGALDTFHEIEQAYQAADSNVQTTVTNLVNARVLQTDFDTAVAARQTTVAQEATYRKLADSYTKTEVDTADNARVLQSAFDSAVAARQTTVDQEATYRKIADSYLQSEVDSAVGARVLQTVFDSAVAARQTTVDQEATYRKIGDSYTKSEVDTKDGLRVLQTDFDTAVAARQTTTVQESTYRKIADSYTKTEVDTADGLRVTQTDFDSAVAARQTTATQEATYRKIADSYTKSEVDTHLSGKQATVGNDHLQISHTNGLQTALDAKGAASTVSSHASTLAAAEATSSAGNTPGSIALFNSNGHIAKAGTVADISGHTLAGTSIVGPYRSAPSSAGDTGTTGEVRTDNQYVYICVNTNAWLRFTHGALTWS